MDDILVVVVTIIVAGIGFISKLKKKKEQAPKTENLNTSKSFWDLIQGESEIPQTETVPDYYESEFEEEEEKQLERKYTEIKSKKSTYHSISSLKSNLHNKKEVVNKKKRTKLKNGLKENFSLRKAVIYSEILNRKYI